MVIELQVMNSDGNPEPEGLQLWKYITAKPQDHKHKNDDARDCRIWYQAVRASAPENDGKTKVYPYLEFIIKKDARTVQTKEDGAVCSATMSNAGNRGTDFLLFDAALSPQFPLFKIERQFADLPVASGTGTKRRTNQ
jgi:hypothetical protein